MKLIRLLHLASDSTTTIRASVFAVALSLFCVVASSGHAAEPKRVVIVAGKPSHPPRMHEFNAGALLLEKCMKGVDGIECTAVLNGWPEDDSILKNANAIVFYMDGGKKHEIVQGDGQRLKMLNELAEQGVGLGFMHYGVEVVPEDAGSEMKSWIGGHYEHMFSCNPIWEPEFKEFPSHPVTRGVKPFKANDEWYFNMRFEGDVPGNEPSQLGDAQFVPILVATPSADVRDGPYVYPRGPYAHIENNAGRPEAMMWVLKRSDGGRGMGFTGGHFHDNWAEPNFRKVVLNSFVWLAGAEVPADGIQSELAPGDIDRNLDPKPAR